MTHVQQIPNEHGGAFFFPRPNVKEDRNDEEEDEDDDDCTALALRDCGRDDEWLPPDDDDVAVLWLLP